MRWPILLLMIATTLSLKSSTLYAAETKPQVLFYLDDNRLITLEFQVTVDEKSFADAWEANLEQLFKKIDKNNDGKIAGEERNGLPNTRVLRVFNQAYTFRAPPDSLDLASFKDYIAKGLGFLPFQITIQNPANLNNRSRLVVSGMPNNANKAAEVLFSHLDKDSDGKLSPTEMKQAQTALNKQDLDQDETISTSELVGFNYNQFFVSPSSPSTPQNNSSFLSLGKGTSPRQVVSQLTQKYDKNPKDNALSQQELGISANLFGKHDIDGNGKWDFEELQQYLKAPTTDVVIQVRLGTQLKSDQSRIAFEHGKELNSDFKNGIGSLNLGNVQMEVSVNANPRIQGSSKGSTGIVEEQLKRQFQAIDRDNNGYIDKEESQRLGNASVVFQDLDPDHDEKVFLEEWLEQILPLAELMSRQVRLTVTDRGRDLFRILDSDGDNRVSTREFWAMPNRAALWDRDADGQITLSEVPRQYRMVVSQGDLSGNGRVRDVVVATAPGMSRPRPNSDRLQGPLWFQRMDRNGDGDLSTREFLGSLDDFTKLDENQDGLISPTEAMLAK